MSDSLGRRWSSWPCRGCGAEQHGPIEGWLNNGREVWTPEWLLCSDCYESMLEYICEAIVPGYDRTKNNDCPERLFALYPNWQTRYIKPRSRGGEYGGQIKRGGEWVTISESV